NRVKAGFVVGAVSIGCCRWRLAADRGDLVRQRRGVEQGVVLEQRALWAQGASEVGHLRSGAESAVLAGAGEVDQKDVPDGPGLRLRFGFRRRWSRFFGGWRG